MVDARIFSNLQLVYDFLATRAEIHLTSYINLQYDQRIHPF